MSRALWLVALVVVAVRSDTGNPLKKAELQQSASFPTVLCYSCIDCQMITSKTPVKECPYTDMKSSKCVTYVEKYQFVDKSWYIRGCASEKGDCSEIRLTHNEGDVTLSTCNECEGDKCNGSHSLTAILTLVVVPILSKIALS